MIKALIFDFDGLIVDTETPWFEVFSDIYQSHHVPLSMDLWIQCVGTSNKHFDPYDYLDEQLGKPLPREEMVKYARARHAEKMAHVQLKGGILTYLQTAKKLKLKIGLASSSSQEWVEGHLKTYRILDYFDCIYTADQVTHVKPHPELYLKVIDCFQIRPREAVAFEDSRNGLTAAKAAGLYCVTVPNPVTKVQDFSMSDFHLTSLADKALEDLINVLK